MIKHTVVTISCGMGNQFFQYAFGYAESRQKKSKLIFYYVNGGENRPFCLDKYKAGKDIRIISEDRKTFLEKVYLKLFHKVDEENPFSFYGFVDNYRRVFYNGYWQNWRYFDQMYDQLKSQFTYIGNYSEAAKRYLSEIGAGSVAIHVRRGDYIRKNASVGLPIEYYKKAYSIIKEYIAQSGNKGKIFIFSDDKSYVKEQFGFVDDYELVQGMADIEEFEIMRYCENHIIANSTFSWWAAYLGENKGGVM